MLPPLSPPVRPPSVPEPTQSLMSTTGKSAPFVPRRKRAFLFLNLDLNGRNGVRGFNIQGNVASRQGFDKDLHPALGKGRGRDQAQQQADGEQNTEQAFFYFGSSLSVSVNSYFICRAVKSRCMTESAIVRMSSAAMVCRISEICASGT